MAALDDWADGLGQRVALQAEIIWPALQDGYSTAGGQDSARPFSQLWWQLQPVLISHCADCPWIAYNSPYDPPGSGGNELAQSPGDGATECGAGCHCTLSYGGFELPQDADWAQYMAPPDAPFVNAPVNPGLIPSTVRQQGAGDQAYRPGRMPIGVSREGDYVYAGTPEEREMAANRGVTPYGAISETRPGDEPFTVAPIARDAQALSTGQLHALDAFRSAWSRWNAVRGARPAARSLFGYVYDESRGTFARPNATAGLLVPQRNPAGFAQRAGPNGERFANSWDELTPRQQAALVDLYRAIASWDSATKDASGAVQNSEVDVDGAVTLTGGHETGYSQNRDRYGHWAEGDGGQHESDSAGGSGEREQMQRESSNAMIRKRGGVSSGGGGGAKLSGAQRAQKEQELAQFTAKRDQIEAAIPKMDAWLASHQGEEPGYDDISGRRITAANAHERLQDLIENRQTLLEQAITARHELAPMPKPATAKEAAARAQHAADVENGRKGAMTRWQDHEKVAPKPPTSEQIEKRRAAARAYHQNQPQEATRARRNAAAAAARERKRAAAANDTERQSRIAELEAKLEAARAAKAAKKAGKPDSDTQRLMEEMDDLLRDCAVLLASSGEDRVLSITLVGGHDEGYDQNRKPNGQWDVGDGGGGSGGHIVHYVDDMKELRASTAAARGDHEAVARVETEREDNRQGIREIFGRDLADHEVASLVGARPGDRVRVERVGHGDVHLNVDGAHDSFHAVRDIRRFESGMIVIRNEYIKVIEQGHGLGAEILARQVSGASRLGVSRIDTTAARSGSMNGYDTWAKLGYDGQLPGGIRTDYGDQLREHGVTRGTVQELMRVTEPVIRLPDGDMVNGHELWKIRGDTWHGTFDLTPGSKNRQVLRAYLEAKGRKPLADELQLKAPADGGGDQPQGEEIDWTPEDDAISLQVWRELDAKWKREEAATRGHQEALDD